MIEEMAGGILAVIPARKGSKGIPRKNIRPLDGEPLVGYALQKSQQASVVDAVALTTDSQEIANIGRKYDVDMVIERPHRLATDEVPLAPVVQHAFEEAGEGFEYILCYQPTVPLLSVSSLESGVQAAVEEGSQSSIFVRDSTHHYWKYQSGEYIPVTPDRMNRQQLDPIYEEIGIFLSHRDLVAAGNRIGDSPDFFEVGPLEGIDIDTYGDWLLAESQLQRKELVYRVTGDEKTGTGHIYRGLTIADHLLYHDIIFVVQPSDTVAIEKLEESNYPYEVVEDDHSFISVLEVDPPDVVANDILDTTAEYIESLAQLGVRVVNFEDLGSGMRQADAVINALYEHSHPPSNHYFGFEYFCLRNEFRFAEKTDLIPSVERLMISFGGSDENDLTAKTLRALSTLDIPLEIEVVLGLGYDNHETLEPLIAEYSTAVDVSVHQEVERMADHMEQADLLVTSNGRTVYEAAALNLPVISIAQNQRELKHPFAHISRGILSLGQAKYVTEANIELAVEELIQDRDQREAMRQSLADHDIETGLDRIIDILVGADDEDW